MCFFSQTLRISSSHWFPAQFTDHRIALALRHHPHAEAERRHFSLLVVDAINEVSFEFDSLCTQPKPISTVRPPFFHLLSLHSILSLFALCLFWFRSCSRSSLNRSTSRIPPISSGKFKRTPLIVVFTLQFSLTFTFMPKCLALKAAKEIDNSWRNPSKAKPLTTPVRTSVLFTTIVTFDIFCPKKVFDVGSFLDISGHLSASEKSNFQERQKQKGKQKEDKEKGNEEQQHESKPEPQQHEKKQEQTQEKKQEQEKKQKSIEGQEDKKRPLTRSLKRVSFEDTSPAKKVKKDGSVSPHKVIRGAAFFENGGFEATSKESPPSQKATGTTVEEEELWLAIHKIISAESSNDPKSLLTMLSSVIWVQRKTDAKKVSLPYHDTPPLLFVFEDAHCESRRWRSAFSQEATAGSPRGDFPCWNCCLNLTWSTLQSSLGSPSRQQKAPATHVKTTAGPLRRKSTSWHLNNRPNKTHIHVLNVRNKLNNTTYSKQANIANRAFFYLLGNMRWSLTYTASFFLWHETWSHCLIAPKGTTYSIGVSTMVTTVIPAKVPSIFLSTAVRHSATLRKILLSVTWASLASKILGNVQQQWRSTVSECQWEIVTGELPYDLADASGRVMIERQEWSPRHEPLSSLVALANVVETFNFDSFNVMHALELLFRRVEALSERSIIFGWVASLVRHRHRPQGSPGFHCHGPKILILLCHLGLKSKGLRILVVRTPREKKKSILPHFWSLSYKWVAWIAYSCAPSPKPNIGALGREFLSQTPSERSTREEYVTQK